MLLRSRLRLLREPGRGFFQDLPLFTQRPVLATQLAQLFALLARQSVLATAVIEIGLADPVPDRLRGGLERLGQCLGRLPGSNQLDQAAAKLRWVRRWWCGLLRHRGDLRPKWSGVHEIGSTPRPRNPPLQKRYWSSRAPAETKVARCCGKG